MTEPRRYSSNFSVTTPRDADCAVNLAALRTNWAFVLADHGKADAALADLDKNAADLAPLLQLEPTEVYLRMRMYQTHGARAQVLETAGRHAESIQAWEQVIALSGPADLFANRMALAAALTRAKEFPRAIGAFEKALAEVGDKPDPDIMCDAAGMCGSLVIAIRTDVNNKADSDRIASRATELALTLLKKARATSAPEKWVDMKVQIRRDQRLTPLRENADFRKLIDD